MLASLFEARRCHYNEYERAVKGLRMMVHSIVSVGVTDARIFVLERSVNRLPYIGDHHLICASVIAVHR